MPHKNMPKGLFRFAIIEICIGLVTFTAVGMSVVGGWNPKPLNVLIFVSITSALSFGLGAGLLWLNKTAYKILLYLVGFVILSKILIFAKIIHLNGALVPVNPNVKNLISIIYHSLLCWYLNTSKIKKLFK